MYTNDNNFYLYQGNIYKIVLLSSVEVGVIKYTRRERPLLSDLELIPKKKWKKALILSPIIVSKLIVRL